MGLFDELEGMGEAAEKAAAEHPEQVKSALHGLEGVIDKETGGKHHDQIVGAGAKAEEYIDKRAKPST